MLYHTKLQCYGMPESFLMRWCKMNTTRNLQEILLFELCLRWNCMLKRSVPLYIRRDCSFITKYILNAQNKHVFRLSTMNREKKGKVLYCWIKRKKQNKVWRSPLEWCNFCIQFKSNFNIWFMCSFFSWYSSVRFWRCNWWRARRCESYTMSNMHAHLCSISIGETCRHLRENAHLEAYAVRFVSTTSRRHRFRNLLTVKLWTHCKTKNIETVSNWNEICI